MDQVSSNNSARLEMDTEPKIKAKQDYSGQEYNQGEQARAQGSLRDFYHLMASAQNGEWIQTRSPFLNLPGEVRNTTYMYFFDVYRISIVMQPQSYRIRQWTTSEFRNGYALVKACRKTFDECLPILYSHCVFKINSRGISRWATRFASEVDHNLLASIRILRMPHHQVKDLLQLDQLSNMLPCVEKLFLYRVDYMVDDGTAWDSFYKEEEAEEPSIADAISQLATTIVKYFKNSNLEIFLENERGVVSGRSANGRIEVFGRPLLLEPLVESLV